MVSGFYENLRLEVFGNIPGFYVVACEKDHMVPPL
jgi:hypothetical protein